MELHPVHRPRAMTQAHDDAAVGARGHRERLGWRVGDDQRMVAAGDERLGDTVEHALAVMLDR